MNLEITKNTVNQAIILTGIYIPGELFGHIVDHLSTQDLWKSGLAFTCKSFYLTISGEQGLLSRKVDANSLEIIAQMKLIKDAYENKNGKKTYFKIYDHPYPNSFLDVIGKLLFGIPLAYQSLESLMFTSSCLKNIAVNTYLKAITPSEDEEPILRQQDMLTSFKLLDRKTEHVIAKIHYISFWLDLWKHTSNDYLKPQIAKSFNLILFGTSVLKIGPYDGHFNSFNSWVHHPDFLQYPLLLDLKIKAWNCLKDCIYSQSIKLKAELAIAAGLICLSNHPISIKLQSEALSILAFLSHNKNAFILKHIANTIILLNKHTIGGFHSLSNEIQFILKTIFNRLCHAEQKTVADKVDAINLFINLSPEHDSSQIVSMDLSEIDYICIDEPDENYAQEPPAKKLKTTPENQELPVIRLKRRIPKDNIQGSPTKKLKKDEES